MTTTEWRRTQQLATWIVFHKEDSQRMALQWIHSIEPTRLYTLFQFTCSRWGSHWILHFLLLKMSIWTIQFFQRRWIIHNRFGVQSRRSLFILFTSILNNFSSRVRHRKKQFQINVSWKGVDRWNEAFQVYSAFHTLSQIRILLMNIYLSA